jgi:hypothetical protein
MNSSVINEHNTTNSVYNRMARTRVYTLPAYEQVVWYMTYKDEGSVMNNHNTTKSVYNRMAKTHVYTLPAYEQVV